MTKITFETSAIGAELAVKVADALAAKGLPVELHTDKPLFSRKVTVTATALPQVIRLFAARMGEVRVPLLHAEVTAA